MTPASIDDSILLVSKPSRKRRMRLTSFNVIAESHHHSLQCLCGFSERKFVDGIDHDRIIIDY
jgi:hypothetical protein